MNKFLIFLTTALLVLSCGEKEAAAEAYGNFEATEILVSSERPGKLITFTVSEGDWIKQHDLIAVVDTSAIQLQQKQLYAQIQAILSRTQSIAPQIAVFDRQLDNLTREQKRVEALVADSAATTQTLDEINGQITVVEQQKEAQLIRLSSTNRSINQEVQPLRVQLELLQDQVNRSIVSAPSDGRILQTYAEASEITGVGKPIAKLADTREMILRVYISGSQLSELKIGQEVSVAYDGLEGTLTTTTGNVSWISDQAEFTPKSLQTREDRVDLVYAAKVTVQNPDGSLKIGMPGEVNW